MYGKNYSLVKDHTQLATSMTKLIEKYNEIKKDIAICSDEFSYDFERVNNLLQINKIPSLLAELNDLSDSANFFEILFREALFSSIPYEINFTNGFSQKSKTVFWTHPLFALIQLHHYIQKKPPQNGLSKFRHTHHFLDYFSLADEPSSIFNNKEKYESEETFFGFHKIDVFDTDVNSSISYITSIAEKMRQKQQATSALFHFCNGVYSEPVCLIYNPKKGFEILISSCAIFNKRISGVAEILKGEIIHCKQMEKRIDIYSPLLTGLYLYSIWETATKSGLSVYAVLDSLKKGMLPLEKSVVDLKDFLPKERWNDAPNNIVFLKLMNERAVDCFRSLNSAGWETFCRKIDADPVYFIKPLDTILLNHIAWRNMQIGMEMMEGGFLTKFIRNAAPDFYKDWLGVLLPKNTINLSYNTIGDELKKHNLSTEELLTNIKETLEFETKNLLVLLGQMVLEYVDELGKGKFNSVCPGKNTTIFTSENSVLLKKIQEEIKGSSMIDVNSIEIKNKSLLSIKESSSLIKAMQPLDALKELGVLCLQQLLNNLKLYDNDFTFLSEKISTVLSLTRKNLKGRIIFHDDSLFMFTTKSGKAKANACVSQEKLALNP